jgi:cell division septation protein DedD
MNIAQYLSELLHQRESVILPGFGEFRTIEQPGGRNASGQLVPPTKTIAFNPSVKANDYVLARYISEKQNQTILKANDAVRDFTNTLLETLAKDGRVALAGVGEFIQANNALVFNPDESINYNIASFGLEPATARVEAETSKPVVTEEKTETEKKTTPIEKAPPAPAEPEIPADPAMHVRRKRWHLWLILLLMMMIAGASWVYLNQDKAYQWYTRCTDWFAADKSTPVLVPGIDTSFVEPFPEDTAIHEPISPEDTVNTTQPDKLKPALPIQPALQSTPGVSGQYAIIAGCFGDQKNAEKMVQQLVAQGFPASIEGKTATGLFRVSAGLYPSAEQAQNYLKQANAGNKLLNAWVLKL